MVDWASGDLYADQAMHAVHLLLLVDFLNGTSQDTQFALGQGWHHWPYLLDALVNLLLGQRALMNE